MPTGNHDGRDSDGVQLLQRSVGGGSDGVMHHHQTEELCPLLQFLLLHLLRLWEPLLQLLQELYNPYKNSHDTTRHSGAPPRVWGWSDRGTAGALPGLS